MIPELKQLLLAGLCCTVLASCDDSGPAVHGPIVLGDSSLIVTENDATQLKDLVVDLKPEIPPAQEPEPQADPADTVAHGPGKPPPAGATPQATTENTQPAQPAAEVAGVKAQFKEITVTIAGIEAKQGGKADLTHASGAVYSLTKGDINGSRLHINGGTILKVSQRYQSIVVMKSEYGDMPLDALTHTESWDEISGSNGVYPVKGLAASSLEYDHASQSGIRNAVQRAAQRKRYSRKKVQEIVSSIRNVRSVNQSPFSVALKTVMWKIDGKDANGRLFSKQIRIDIPM